MRRKFLAIPLALCAALAAVTVAVPAQADPVGTLACTSIPATHDPAITLIVYRVARAHNVNDKVLLSAFEAGWVESHMNNLPCGDKTSLGVFQQRWDYGWGTPEQIMDPVYATTQYVTRAVVCDSNNPGYTAGQVAQCVQRSGFPDRYDQAAAKARTLLAEAARTHAIAGGSSTDVTGDGRDDVLTFTQNALADVYVANSTGTAFAGTSVKWNDFFSIGGETASSGDVNGDGRDDIVTFAHSNTGDVYVALSNGSSFGGGQKWHDWFAPGAEIGAVGDVNGDGRDDIVAFTHNAAGDVYVALSTGTSFGPGQKWHEFFSPFGEYPAVGDVDGDGKADLITFTQGSAADVIVARSTGTSFGAAQKWHDLFAVGAELPRVGDVNGDGKDDIVTFTCDANADVYAAVSNGDAFVGTTVKWNDFFCLTGEFPYLGDFDGDGRDDIVVFTKGSLNDVYVGLSTGTSFGGGAKWHDFFGLNGEATL
ncbi:FG-GAP repeat domain-containing protein [Micromonospora avicenniae]|uniref:FG-GAP repeat domain-containing protein n=1 Tax=Micromonospora avicenniae TaxID=1198245 RepID=UPI003444F8D5